MYTCHDDNEVGFLCDGNGRIDLLLPAAGGGLVPLPNGYAIANGFPETLSHLSILYCFQTGNLPSFAI